MSGKRRRKHLKKIVKKKKMEALLHRLKYAELQSTENTCKLLNDGKGNDSKHFVETVSKAPSSATSEVLSAEDDQNIDPQLQTSDGRSSDAKEKRRNEFSPQKRMAKRPCINSSILSPRSRNVWPIKNDTGNLISWLDAAEQIMESSVKRSKRIFLSTSPAPNGRKPSEKRAKSAFELSFQSTKFENRAEEPMDTIPADFASSAEETFSKTKRTHQVSNSLSSNESNSLCDSVTRPKKRTKSISKNLDVGFGHTYSKATICSKMTDNDSQTALEENCSLQFEETDQMRGSHIDSSLKSTGKVSYSSTEKIMQVVEFEENSVGKSEFLSKSGSSSLDLKSHEVSSIKQSSLPVDTSFSVTCSKIENSKRSKEILSGLVVKIDKSILSHLGESVLSSDTNKTILPSFTEKGASMTTVLPSTPINAVAPSEENVSTPLIPSPQVVEEPFTPVSHAALKKTSITNFKVAASTPICGRQPPSEDCALTPITAIPTGRKSIREDTACPKSLSFVKEEDEASGIDCSKSLSVMVPAAALRPGRGKPSRSGPPAPSRPAITVEDLKRVQLRKTSTLDPAARRALNPHPQGPVVSLEQLRGVRLRPSHQRTGSSRSNTPRPGARRRTPESPSAAREVTPQARVLVTIDSNSKGKRNCGDISNDSVKDSTSAANCSRTPKRSRSGTFIE